MKVKVRRAYFGAEGNVREGQIFDISESRFRQLTEGIHLHHPLVDAMEIGYKMQPSLLNKMEPPPANKEAPGSSVSFRDNRRRAGEEAAKKGTADPTPSPPVGGQTGAVSAASLSEQAPPRQKRKYTRRAVAPE